MKTFVSRLDDVVGKTISAISFTDSDRFLVVVCSDDTVLMVRADAGYDGDSANLDITSFLYSPVYTDQETTDTMIALGILSQDTVDQARNEMAERNRQARERDERAQLARLQAKYKE